MEIKNSFCGYRYEKTNWTNLSEAAEKCSQDDLCTMFFDDCGNGTFWRCPGKLKYGELKEMESGCDGTTLYKKGIICNHSTTKIFI